ncbi:unnamed protein product [Adineta steineri]|uniref:Uncharacterized protein n=1 Tax=Adineta steineri TaxID=433720 RepID=A0A814HRY8_9BILA|nr:unnamed protein product [Adineta steineri]CAF4021947.1 unnamed protein product [Adineta steineri]
MVRRRRNISSKKVSHHRNETIQQIPSDNLDDETKLAKRHLTKEMWQLVAIAVKRMADELISTSKNQQTTLPIETNTLSTQSSMIKNTGEGDVPSIPEKSTIFEEPIQMLEPSLHIKKKALSNNAIRRSKKSKVQNKSSKKNRKNNNYKYK